MFGWLVGWLVSEWVSRIIAVLISQSMGWSIVCMVSQSFSSSAGRPVSDLLGRLGCWWVGLSFIRSVSWLFGMFIGRSCGHVFRLVGQSFVWPVIWQVDWLVCGLVAGLHKRLGGPQGPSGLV